MNMMKIRSNEEIVLRNYKDVAADVNSTRLLALLAEVRAEGARSMQEKAVEVCEPEPCACDSNRVGGHECHAPRLTSLQNTIRWLNPEDA